MEEFSAELRAKCVLVVDENPSERALLSSIIKCFGISRVFSATNAAEALVILEAQAVDIVYSDWQTQLKDKVYLHQWLENNARFSDIPLVLITPNEPFEQVEALIEVGRRQLLTKPFKARVIHSMMQQLFATTLQTE